jgi:formylglycine-generating enzyme required for sulfatase activity/tRNA A-37 threonylcarbamoyl transferase component Bud32
MSRDSDDYARLHEIVSGARSLSGDELESYLAAECGDDDELRSEVRELLEVGHDDGADAPFADGHLDQARVALEGVLEDTTSSWLPDKIGDYTILRQIGQGGMGVVYEAEQLAPKRRVAIKLLHPLQATDERLRRFRNEVALLGQLQHPGIARIYEASTYDAGRGPQPFFAMELVDGVDLRTYCERNELARAARLDLLARVADIVQHAHEHGIVHRDLKPDNILVDQRGHPRVLDFGIAHAGADSTALSTALTKEGQLVGTLAYMAPEQLRQDGGAVTPRVDVFALGVLGFELLLGRLPRETEDLPLAQYIGELAGSEPTRAGVLDTDLRGDVDTILGKALETEPSRRYESAAALAADLRRHLANEPIRAHPPSTAYLVAKFVKRNRPLVAGAVATLVVAVVGAVIATVFGLAATRRASEVETKNKDILRLSAAEDYEDLIQRAGTLWPPHPDRKGALATWIVDARRLRGELGALETKRDELRALALPRTEREREGERRSHPDFAELETVTAELKMRRRAVAHRRDGIDAPLPEVDWDAQPSDAAGLHSKARPLVHPSRTTYGDEALALVLAERAFELAPKKDRWSVAMTLALANFELGRDDAALVHVRQVAEEGTGEARAGRERAIEALVRAIEDVNSEHGLENQLKRVEELEARELELEEVVDERLAWTAFPPEVEAESRPRWWLEQLDGLIGELESLTAPGALLTDDGVSAEHGWSLPRRLAFAERLETAFAPGGEYAQRWEAALPQIHAAYPGLQLGVQMGLVPLGTDPASGLFEFWHVQSGSEPARGDEGALAIDAATGLVFVLLPATTYNMGAQLDPKNWNDDPDARPDEGKVREVQLSAFFLSKYELTQAQWRRAVGDDPSRWTEETLPRGWLAGPHPVEQVSWHDCVGRLAMQGLTLPSEAQWEYACRAGTDTPWPFEPDELVSHANLADRRYKRQFEGVTSFEDWDDGVGAHGPVGRLAPNPFGLHDMVGNVAEWCLDGYDAAAYKDFLPVDPVHPARGAATRVYRGGSCVSTAVLARSSARSHAAPALAEIGVGVRPARAVSR